ncbi:MAG TPA: hypothetical protein VE196_10960 [Pseudonocardiaceae bacterium]|nr:hypothetical protein [Pseudonocardiaceae bacterium]
MQQALRPYASAGVALAGAGLIAITPVAGTALESQSRAVQLTSTGSPLDLGDLLSPVITDQPYPIITPAELASDTATNLQDLQNQIVNDPAPILEQIIANQAMYSNDLATAAENAGSDFTAALQGLPDVLQQASADFASGDVYDGLTLPSSYLLSSVLEVNHDLLNGTSEVAQGMANSLDNLVNDVDGAVTNYLSTDAVPTWLTELIYAPLYGPNAALAGFAGVSQDIVTAANSGDFSTVLSDLANAPSTIMDAFLNGYDVGAGTAPAPIAQVVSDVAMRIGGLNPAYGLLTGAAEERMKDLLSPGFGNQGTIENIYEASLRIANDLAGTRAADGPIADLFTGAGASTGLPDLSTLVGELTSALNPSTLLGDFTGLLDPSAISDLGAQLTADLGPDLSSVLLSLF